ncbi:methyl-accepting chemotaxis protein [Pararhodobacter sp. CCB-MM2]|uniref:methyl-accepting chemotaxis protein n=1 Tax=Pararhodobacter sp. CCB-MM2 TaxID=1786003 RepID=UPI00082AF6A0|nr:methyl-accepting chemotaxis protein [Pararhodobacter sp. CCB-MM2]
MRDTTQPHGPAGDSGAIKTMAAEAGTLSVLIANALGHADAVSGELTRQVRTAEQLRNAARDMSTGSAEVEAATSAASTATASAAELRKATRHGFEKVIAEVKLLAEEVDGLETCVEGLAHALDRVGRVAEEIASVAQMTNMLALNAQVEAARAGSAGRGFMVVAQEVKAMSERTAAATSDIGQTLDSLRAAADQIANTNARVLARTATMQDEARNHASVRLKVDEAIAEVDRQQARIDEARRNSAQSVRTVEGGILQLADSVTMAERGITGVRDTFDNILGLSQRLTADFARLGVETVDSPFINAVQAGAAQISEAFEKAVASGKITLNDLFDAEYRAVQGSDPKQVLTRFTALTDQLLPPIQEPMLKLSPLVVFCAAVDRNGYLPTHNRVFSQPQRRGDPAWNAANCRNRRMFDDRVGLTAGRSKQAFTLQAYRRDMGGGQFVMMKDVSAPITVRGRHWGGLRLAYKLPKGA